MNQLVPFAAHASPPLVAANFERRADLIIQITSNRAMVRVIFTHFLRAEFWCGNIPSLTAVSASIAGGGRGRAAAAWTSRTRAMIRTKLTPGIRSGNRRWHRRSVVSSMRRRVCAMLTRRKGDVDLVELAEHGNHPVKREASKLGVADA